MKSHKLLKNRIFIFRIRKGLTQSELAKFVGCSKNTINCLETNRFCPSSYLALKLCMFFDCKFEDLFYF